MATQLADSTFAATLRLDGNDNNNFNGARFFTVVNFNARSTRNKSASIGDIICEHKFQVLAITESWQDGDDDLSIKRDTPRRIPLHGLTEVCWNGTNGAVDC